MAQFAVAAQLAARDAEKVQRAAAERLAEWVAARELTPETRAELMWARMVCGAARMALRSRVVLKWRPTYGWRRLVKRLLGPPSCGVPEPGRMTLVDELLEYRRMQREYKQRGGFVAGDDSGDSDDSDDFDGGCGIVPDDDYYSAYDADVAYRQAVGPVDAWLGQAMALCGVQGAEADDWGGA